MESDETIERIKSCMFMEYACSSVYHLLALDFPEEKELWNKLAMDDERHAIAIAEGMEIKESDMPADFDVPADLSYVKDTIELAHHIRDTLINKTPPLKDTLESMKRLHELKNESYSHDLIGKVKAERVKRVFERIFEIDKSNMDLLRSFITKFEAVNPEDADITKKFH